MESSKTYAAFASTYVLQVPNMIKIHVVVN